jgi:hypothetical protein
MGAEIPPSHVRGYGLLGSIIGYLQGQNRV